MEGRLEAVEIWFLRRMFRISWTDHVSNEEVLRRAGREGNLVKKSGRTGVLWAHNAKGRSRKFDINRKNRWKTEQGQTVDDLFKKCKQMDGRSTARKGETRLS